MERELNALKAKEQNGRKVSEHLEEVISEENSGISYNNNNNTTPVEKQENLIQGIKILLELNKRSSARTV